MLYSSLPKLTQAQRLFLNYILLEAYAVKTIDEWHIIYSSINILPDAIRVLILTTLKKAVSENSDISYPRFVEKSISTQEVLSVRLNNINYHFFDKHGNPQPQDLNTENTKEHISKIDILLSLITASRSLGIKLYEHYINSSGLSDTEHQISTWKLLYRLSYGNLAEEINEARIEELSQLMQPTIGAMREQGLGTIPDKVDSSITSPIGDGLPEMPIAWFTPGTREHDQLLEFFDDFLFTPEDYISTELSIEHQNLMLLFLYKLSACSNAYQVDKIQEFFDSRDILQPIKDGFESYTYTDIISHFKHYCGYISEDSPITGYIEIIRTKYLRQANAEILQGAIGVQEVFHAYRLKHEIRNETRINNTDRSTETHIHIA